jgi:hypothetical protein
MRQLLISLVVCILLLIIPGIAACGPSKSAVIDTQMTAGTIIGTVSPTLTLATPTVIAFTPSPSRTPEFILAPDEGEPIYPLAKLRILSPGEGSRLVSPVQPELSILLGVDNTVEVELLNSSGVMLVKKLLRYPGVEPTQRIMIHPQLDFEIAGEEEAGRLVVKTYDSFNRLLALTSCDLTLLASGENEVVAARVPYETFLITEPASGAFIQGGVVTVSGYARLVSQSAIVFELIDENGAEIANRVLILKVDGFNTPTVFSTTIPYHVERKTPVRLIIRQTKSGMREPAIAFSILFSIQ